jgi:hypothetical protein
LTKQIERVRKVRRSLETVCERLQRPSIESWKASEKDLNAAVVWLHDLEQNLQPAREAKQHSQMLVAELAGIRREISKAQALLLAAGKFYQGWARLMSSAEEGTANYTQRGSAAPVPAINSGQVVIHG